MVDLGMEAEGAERVRGLAVGGSRRGRVDRHPAVHSLPRSYKPLILTLILAGSPHLSEKSYLLLRHAKEGINKFYAKKKQKKH